MTLQLDEPRQLMPSTRPVIAVIGDPASDGSDAALVDLIRRLGFAVVLHDVDVPAPRPGFAVVAVATSAARLDQLAAMREYRMATIVGVGVGRGADELLSPEGTRRLLTVLGDAAAQHAGLILDRRP